MPGCSPGPRASARPASPHAAARRVLADAAGPPFDLPGIETAAEHPIVKLVEAGSHPDMRWLERVLNDEGREPQPQHQRRPGARAGRVLRPDAGDVAWRVGGDRQRSTISRPSGANALLKMLEEPPANSMFLLVSHAPGRLLPTIRSRCRRLDFQKLDDDAMTSILEAQAPVAQRSRAPARHRHVGRLGREGAGLCRARPRQARGCGARDPAPGRSDQRPPGRARAASLARKASADRYAAFLDLAPSLIAREARGLDGAPRERALDAYAKARELAAIAPRLSLDPAATVFQLGGHPRRRLPHRASLKR